MFGDCTTLHSIDFSRATIVAKLSNGCLENCVSLQEIVLPPRLEIIGNNTFKECKTLANIAINKDVCYIGNHSFEGCLGLHSINLCNGIEQIGCYTFLMHLSLTTIVIPGSVPVVGPGFFSQCSQLKEVPFNKNKWSKIKEKHYSTFEDCTSLKTFKVLWHVHVISKVAFRNCVSLEIDATNVKVFTDKEFENCPSLGMVQAWVAHFVTSITLP